MRFSQYSLLATLLALVRADVDVQVGANGQLRFSPETINANIGELVNFHLHGNTHTVGESTARLRDPCNTEGGFDSGGTHDGEVFSIIISTHNSIYVHCKPHCGKGMVMIVNPGPNDSVETFREAAEKQDGGGGNPPPPAPKTFEIVLNSASNKCLTASSNNNGAAVTLQSCSRSSNQLWSNPPGPSGQIKVFGSKCLDVTNGANKDGTKLQIWDCSPNNNPNQKWNFNGGGNGEVVWNGGNSNRCLDNTNGNTGNGNRLQIWDCVGNGNQLWRQV